MLEYQKTHAGLKGLNNKGDFYMEMTVRTCRREFHIPGIMLKQVTFNGGVIPFGPRVEWRGSYNATRFYDRRGLWGEARRVTCGVGSNLLWNQQWVVTRSWVDRAEGASFRDAD